MIKTLQKKFVFASMTAISILILILLGTINMINISMVRDEMVKTLTMISEAKGDFEYIQTSSTNTTPPPDFRGEPKDAKDKFMSSNFFCRPIK